MRVERLVVHYHLRGGNQWLAVVYVLTTRHPGNVVAGIDLDRQRQIEDVTTGGVEGVVLIRRTCRAEQCPTVIVITNVCDLVVNRPIAVLCRSRLSQLVGGGDGSWTH